MEGDEENGENACRFADISGASRDVIHKLVKRSRSPTEYVEREREREKEKEEELELSLGLSMNGRFGADPAVKKKMRRRSSVSNIALNVGNGGEQGAERGAHAPLVRTCSMPPDTRRREDGSKLKNAVDGEGLHEDANVKMTQSPEGSIESVEGTTQRTMKESSSCNQFITNMGTESGPTVVIANTNTTDGAPVKNSLMDMPYVSTKGFGPNHNKIKGFLYRYKRGEEVKIVCVCHGMFLSPAEFVRHGGGGDVAYPLKHIVVNPFPLC